MSGRSHLPRPPGIATLLAAVLLGSAPAPVQAQEPGPEAPQERPADLREQVEVNLVIVETLVLDGQGRTVAGLTQDDFYLTVQGRAQEIDTFDAICPSGPADEPGPLRGDAPRTPVAPTAARRLVLVFDYYHLPQMARVDVLRQAQAMMLRDKTPGDEVMIASLANRLRIEQRFTRDPQVLIRALERMEYDVTLWARQFEALTERSFFDNLATLADVLAAYEGPKAVVLYSMMMTGSAGMDLWFGDVARHAAAARTVIYPVWAGGMEGFGPTGGSPALARLANESGGRFTRNTSDLSMGYARAQRDLSCRYALGFYTDAESARANRTVRVRTKQRGLEVRSPEQLRQWTEEERREARRRAAFVDPEMHEDPFVRAHLFPLRPESAKSWATLATLHFPWPIGSAGREIRVSGTLDRGYVTVERFRRAVDLGETPAERESLPVTLYGLARMKPGAYSLTIALESPGSDNLQTTSIDVTVPEVPEGRLFVRGPVLARATAEGRRFRIDGKADNVLDEAIGPGGSFEPLVLHQIELADTLLALWEVCAVGDDVALPDPAFVERRVVRDGVEILRLETVPLALEGKKKVRCQDRLDRIEGGTLEPGHYRLEVDVTGPDGGDEGPDGVVAFSVR